jgi:hypothetical protein
MPVPPNTDPRLRGEDAPLRAVPALWSLHPEPHDAHCDGNDPPMRIQPKPWANFHKVAGHTSQLGGDGEDDNEPDDDNANEHADCDTKPIAAAAATPAIGSCSLRSLQRPQTAHDDHDHDEADNERRATGDETG